MRDKFGEEWFLMDNDYTGGGEDRRFFERAREVGYPAYVDRSCVVGHLAGDTPIGVMDFMVYNSVSNILGTGERGAFRVENIVWNSGSEPLMYPPNEILIDAMKKIENGEAKIGGAKLEPGFAMIGNYIT